MSKESLLREGIPEGEIVEILVPSKTLFQIMTEQNFERIDLLQIDTEGFDFEILKHALGQSIWPSIIHFETLHLSRSDKLHSRKLLREKGYSFIESETDTLAYRLDRLA